MTFEANLFLQESSQSVVGGHIDLYLETPTTYNVSLQYMASFRQKLEDEDTSLNTTWSDVGEILIPNLAANTLYDVVVYVRAKDNEETEQSTGVYEIQSSKDSISIAVTMSFIPTAPWNVTLKRLSPTEVLVNWNAPYHYNTTYRVSLSPSSPPYSIQLGGNYVDHLVRYDFVDGVKYTFTVEAEESHSSCDGESTDSYMVFDNSAIDMVKMLDVQEISSSWAFLTWEPVNDVSGYTIRTECNNEYAWYPVINTTETSCNVTGLSPGVLCTFYVSAYRPQMDGQPALAMRITEGETLPTVKIYIAFLVSGDVTAVNLFWGRPNQPRVEWEYGIFYGTSGTDMLEHGVRHRTRNNTFTVANLDACETYLFTVIVIGPLGYGPADQLIPIKTGIDFNAPPKNVVIQHSTDNITNTEISWSPPCDPGDSVLDYWITIQDISLDATTNLSLSSDNNRLSLRQSLHWGAQYDIFIQLDRPEARAFGPISVSGPSMPAPEKLSIEKKEDGDVLHWMEPDLDPELIAHGYSYRIRLSESLQAAANETFLFDTDEKMLLLSRQWQIDNLGLSPNTNGGKVEKVLYATVSIVEVHGYESTPSTPFTVTLTSKAPSIVYTALAIAGGIVLILAIIVLVIRWRRRRRYSKTNNRYHTRSGSASVRLRSGSNY